MEVYRIVNAKWSNQLTSSGRAARWNSNGVFITYTGSSRALACLENIVHYGSLELAKLIFRTMVIYIPDNVEISLVGLSDLPRNWHLSDEDAYQLCRPFGDNWIKDNKTAVLKVPSAIVKSEYNYLINPNHKDFNRIKIIEAEPFFFDPRLKHSK